VIVRTGPILAEPRSVDLDRREVSYPLWEEGAAAAVDLPWAEATSLASASVIALLAGARTAMVVGGKSAAASVLLEHCLGNLPPACRLYVYGPRAWEAHAAIKPKLASMAARVLPRLGFDTPADWLVVDGGRAALLLVGPAAAERRWLLRLDGPLARALHEAGRTLFWFHAVREGLPDEPGSFGFRTPLPAPFPDPGATVALAAGIDRVRSGARRPDRRRRDSRCQRRRRIRPRADRLHSPGCPRLCDANPPGPRPRARGLDRRRLAAHHGLARAVRDAARRGAESRCSSSGRAQPRSTSTIGSPSSANSPHGSSIPSAGLRTLAATSCLPARRLPQ
jgi:hypothetical protein